MTDTAGAARQFRDLAKNLKAVGEDGLRRELYDAINEAAQPIDENIRLQLPGFLPNPYAAVLDGDMTIRVSKRTGSVDPGVRITATTRGGRRKIRRLNAGTLAHPLWGNRRHWYGQRLPSVQPGFFDKPVEAAAPRVREQILAAMRRVEDKALGR